MTELTDDNYDEKVDEEINACLSLEKPKSFFMFAGAGSGKTRSLVNSIMYILDNHRSFLRLHGKYVCVITYTNAATNEIQRRVKFDPIVNVSTIHSFVWQLIEGFNVEIREWLICKLTEDIKQLKDEQSRARSLTNKASIDRSKKIVSKTNRLNALDTINKFTYNPNGENGERDSLAHSEVIGIAAHLLSMKPVLQQILIQKYPFLLIDESQDTNAKLLEAFMTVQAAYPNLFSLGLFGDTMQRIYFDGKLDLGKNLPNDWAQPVKEMNHRCPRRIVKLINMIRMTTDKQQQRPRSDIGEGVVRLFLLSGNATKKMELEASVAKQMAVITSDEGWIKDGASVKRLILEHHMATQRMGFTEMFKPLYDVEKLRTRLLDGTLPGIVFFSRNVLPVVKASKTGDAFTIATVIRKYSPLLNKQILHDSGDFQMDNLKKSRYAVARLCEVCGDGKMPTFGDVLTVIAQNALFAIPECFSFFTSRTPEEQKTIEAETRNAVVEGDIEENSTTLEAAHAWEKFLNAPFSQLELYQSYVTGEGGFGTHQGVKGLQFPRVMVIMDDAEARGWQFSYDRLFGAKADVKSNKPSDDPDKTKRLFYVTCSRAEKSLALVAYTMDREAVKRHVINNKWFEESEVIFIDKP
jgi:DNA helicase-2/ATP-dependent DNA helicase PcrA